MIELHLGDSRNTGTGVVADHGLPSPVPTQVTHAGDTEHDPMRQPEMAAKQPHLREISDAQDSIFDTGDNASNICDSLQGGQEIAESQGAFSSISDANKQKQFKDQVNLSLSRTGARTHATKAHANISTHTHTYTALARTHTHTHGAPQC